MSHFTVLVIGDDVEGQLAPFQENNMGDCPQEYLEFEDRTEEMRSNYDTGYDIVYMKDGVMYRKYDELVNEARKQQGIKDYSIPEGFTEAKLLYKEKYPTFEQYVDECEGYKEPDHLDEDGKPVYGYWENPNAQWDWYQIGGRWAGTMICKPEFRSEYPPIEFSWGWSDADKAKVNLNSTDICKVGHLDIETMKSEQAKKLTIQYGKFMLYKDLKRKTIKQIVDYVLEKQDKTSVLFRSIDKAEKRLTREQIDHLLKADLVGWGGEKWLEYALEHSLEEYIEHFSSLPFSTYAVLKDGEWYERGQMWWWGMSSNEKDDDVWEKEFTSLIEGLDPDTLLTVVDCHI